METNRFQAYPTENGIYVLDTQSGRLWYVNNLDFSVKSIHL